MGMLIGLKKLPIYGKILKHLKLVPFIDETWKKGKKCIYPHNHTPLNSLNSKIAFDPLLNAESKQFNKIFMSVRLSACNKQVLSKKSKPLK